MRALRWSTSHAIWIQEIDDEHKEIFEELAAFEGALGAGTPPEIRTAFDRLTNAVTGHFAHEERLMRAARYPSMGWHKRQHDGAVAKIDQLAPAILEGDAEAGGRLVDYVTGWLHDHMQVADRMMGSYLRNRRRVAKLTFRVGTKAADACDWVDSKGDRFDPMATSERL